MRTRRDRKYWPDDLKELAEDPVFDQEDDNNIWGREVPEGWPEDPAEAETKYLGYVEQHGCPFAWLLGL